MLMNLHKKGWTEGLKLTDFEKHHEGNEESVKVSPRIINSDLWTKFRTMLTLIVTLITAYRKCSTSLNNTTSRSSKNPHCPQKNSRSDTWVNKIPSDTWETLWRRPWGSRSFKGLGWVF
jgi:hypothetical protein